MESLQHQIDIVRDDLVTHEAVDRDRWKDHMQFHSEEKKDRAEARRFLFGVVGLSVVNIAVTILLHFA